jgi:antimicrobial peptide system SdpB family protein
VLASAFEPRGIAYAVLRTTLALQTLVVVVLDPDGYLFPAAGAPRCTGLHGASLWCLGEGTGVARVVTVAVLALAASGWRPQVLCVPHWYVTFSLAAAMPVPIGGDYVAQIATLLLVPMCLGDRRVWHWERVTDPLAPMWRGAAYASSLVLRLQVVVIYLIASGSKMAAARWRDGTVIYTLAIDPQYGMPPWLRQIVSVVFSSREVAAVATWTAMLGELAIVVLLWGPFRLRVAAFVIGLLLHTTIAVAFGLPTFGVVMIAVLAFAAFAGRERGEWRPRSRSVVVSTEAQEG